ncbi:hypothetical protein HPB52_019697 [Rhipicephalus sanguineus]|uniref:Tc1-like transposase DDE domain-containing protein n=1 Tax=Rhipicephalus sanguineus TaxID=34632 RepID=A0A9D4SV26_RHISA|nr:hypothetical protein HPB52_019697 [Rhipicephalus sanguineus]
MEPSEVTLKCDPLLPNEPCVAMMATAPRSLGKNKSGHILKSDSRNVIFHCYTYWRNREPEHSVEDTNNEISMVEKITTELSKCIELPSLRPYTVRCLLAEIGFKHEKRSRNSLLIDRDDSTDWRNRYLHDMERYWAEGRKIFYLDETWATAGHTRSIEWTDIVVQKRESLFARANGLTTAPIVMHIGSEDGFVDVCIPRFNDVLQKLPAGSVIVLDNAPYHSRREEKLPTLAWKKEKIQEWLTSKNITYSERMIKKQLLELVASVNHVVSLTLARCPCSCTCGERALLKGRGDIRSSSVIAYSGELPPPAVFPQRQLASGD